MSVESGSWRVWGCEEVVEREKKVAVTKVKNEAFLRYFFQKIKPWITKTKMFFKTSPKNSCKNKTLKHQNEAFL